MDFRKQESFFFTGDHQLLQKVIKPRLAQLLGQLHKQLHMKLYQTVFFELASSLKPSMKLPICFYWQDEAKNCGFTHLHQEEAILPNVFQNSFSFAREAASLKKLLHQLFQEQLKQRQTGLGLVTTQFVGDGNLLAECAKENRRPQMAKRKQECNLQVVQHQSLSSGRLLAVTKVFIQPPPKVLRFFLVRSS